MEMCFKSRGLSKYLEINAGTDRYLTEKGYIYQIHMLEENNIRHLLGMTSICIDGSIRLKYETGTMYVADRYIREYKVNGALLSSWLCQILDCITDMEKYLLNPDNLIILPEYMFLDGSQDGLFMVYAVGYEESAAAQIKKLVEYCMQRFDAHDREGINFLYVVHELVSADKLSFEELRGMVSGYGAGNKYNEPDSEEKYLGTYRHDEEPVIYGEDTGGMPDFDKASRNISPLRISILAANILAAAYLFFKYVKGRENLILYAAVLLVVVFVIHLIFCMGEPEDDIDEIMKEYKEGGETLNAGKRMSEDGEYAAFGALTVEDMSDIASNGIYAAGRQQEYDNINKLVPLTDGGLADMDLSELKKPCVIGRDRKEASYRLNTTQISRIHACIYNENGGYYIEDRESTNGTYVNSVKIGALERVRLSKGDIVSFANEEFFVS